jgi:HAMP domain-containing protein
MARFVRQPLLWSDSSWSAPHLTLVQGPVWRHERAGDFELRSVALAVDPDLAPRAHGGPAGIADGPPYPGSSGIGAVQLVVSTERLEHSMSFVGRLGLALLALALTLALAGSWSLIRLVTRPLREASDLARAIANGQLDRRLPVRSDGAQRRRARASRRVHERDGRRAQRLATSRIAGSRTTRRHGRSDGARGADRAGHRRPDRGLPDRRGAGPAHHRL